tara:strand:+ start:349 stop:615 length:267 start_codon:yes stop_codon:yes gene_type:complete
MIFRVLGTRTRTIVITETIEGEIDITKKEVQRITDCPNVEDGDSTAWYGYVGEALEGGANCKLVEVDRLEEHQSEKEEWDSGVEVDWG